MASTRQDYLAAIKESVTPVAVKPTHFLRFKSGDFDFKQEMIKNNPIQANRWNALNAVKGKISTAGKFEIDLDPNECVYWIYAALGAISSADISSLTDASVYKHTITLANTLPSFSVEQGKGNLTDTTGNRQKYTVERGYGVLVDSITASASDGIINLSAELKAHGVFQRAVAVSDEDAEAVGTSITAATWLAGVATITSATHGLVAGDLVVISGITPAAYNGAYRVLSINGSDFTVAIASTPGSYSTGGTVTKQSQIAVDSVEGLAVGDSVNVVQLTTPANELATITVIDTIGKQIGFASLTATTFTVANGTKIELAPQTPGYSVNAKVFSFTHASFQFGATLAAAANAAEVNIENWELVYKNNLEERYGSLRASPSVIAPKGAEAGVKFTKYFETIADRDIYLSQVGKGCILTLTNNEIVSATDTLQAKYSVVFKMNDFKFTTYEMTTGTDELYAYAVEGTAFYSAADGAAFSAEVINPNAGTVYTA